VVRIPEQWAGKEGSVMDASIVLDGRKLSCGV
jgi:hypothetical protein